jgi:hypothetical protein
MFVDSYLTALDPFLKFCNAFGFYPVNFRNHVQKGSLKFTWIAIMKALAVFMFLSGMMFFVIRNHITFMSENQPFIGMLVWSWFLSASYPVMIIHFVLHIIKLKDMHRFFKFMNEIDGKIRKLFIKIDYRRHQRVILWSTVLTIVTLLGRFCTSMGFGIVNIHLFTTRANIIAQEVCYACFLFYESFFVLQFIFVAYLLRERFALLKSLLRYMLNLFPSDITWSSGHNLTRCVNVLTET